MHLPQDLALCRQLGPRGSPAHFLQALKGRAQNCTRRAALRDQEVSIVLDHTAITRILATVAHPETLSQGEEGTWVQAMSPPGQSAPCVQGGLRKLRSKQSNVRTLSQPVGDTSGKDPYPETREPTHPQASPPSGQPLPLAAEPEQMVPSHSSGN